MIDDWESNLKHSTTLQIVNEIVENPARLKKFSTSTFHPLQVFCFPDYAIASY
jgi:hypothetical protein